MKRIVENPSCIFRPPKSRLIIGDLPIIALSLNKPAPKHTIRDPDNNWVAVNELKLSYYIGETLLFTIYTHYGNLI